MTSESEVEAFFSESVVMKDFQHPNVLGLLGVVFDTPDGVPYLVLPFMKNGNLKDYLKSRRMKASDIDTLPQVSITMLHAILFIFFLNTCTALKGLFSFET